MTYGYFYQFDRNASFLAHRADLSLEFNFPNAPTGFGVISNTFGPSINSDLSGPVITGHRYDGRRKSHGHSRRSSYLLDLRLSEPQHGRPVRTQCICGGRCLSILYFTDKDALRLPLDVSNTATPNAFILDSAGGVMFTNFVDTPFVPEPSTVQLFLIGEPAWSRSDSETWVADFDRYAANKLGL